MPSLKQLTCHVEWAGSGVPFQEYGTVYGDGVVESYIAIPKHSTPFSINLKSKGYISSGLAMFVFMDGVYQCNRSRDDLRYPDDPTDPEDITWKRAEIDFRVRQKEECGPDLAWVGRPWRFEPLNIVQSDSKSYPEPVSHFDHLSTIQVIVMRCVARPGDNAARWGEISLSRSLSPESATAPAVDIEGNDSASEEEQPEPNKGLQAMNTFWALFDGPGGDWQTYNPPQNHRQPSQNTNRSRSGGAQDDWGGPAVSNNHQGGSYNCGPPPSSPVQRPGSVRWGGSQAGFPSPNPSVVVNIHSNTPQTQGGADANSTWGGLPRSDQGQFETHSYSVQNGKRVQGGDWHQQPSPTENNQSWGNDFNNSNQDAQQNNDTDWAQGGDQSWGGDPQPHDTDWGDSGQDNNQTGADDWASNPYDRNDNNADTTGNDNSGNDAWGNDAWGNDASGNDTWGNDTWQDDNQDNSQDNNQTNTGDWGDTNNNQNNTETWGNTNGDDAWGTGPAEASGGNTNQSGGQNDATQQSSNGWGGSNHNQNTSGDWETNKPASCSNGRGWAADPPRSSPNPPRQPPHSHRSMPQSGGTKPQVFVSPRFNLAEKDEPDLYTVPLEVAASKSASHQVQPGPASRYTHKVRTPGYVDSLDKPYAMFVFKYRVKEVIEQKFGVTVERDAEAEKRKLESLPRDVIINQLLHAQGILGDQAPPLRTKAASNGKGKELRRTQPPPPKPDLYRTAPIRQGSVATSARGSGSWGHKNTQPQPQTQPPAPETSHANDTNWGGTDWAAPEATQPNQSTSNQAPADNAPWTSTYGNDPPPASPAPASPTAGDWGDVPTQPATDPFAAALSAGLQAAAGKRSAVSSKDSWATRSMGDKNKRAPPGSMQSGNSNVGRRRQGGSKNSLSWIAASNASNNNSQSGGGQGAGGISVGEWQTYQPSNSGGNGNDNNNNSSNAGNDTWGQGGDETGGDTAAEAAGDDGW